MSAPTLCLHTTLVVTIACRQTNVTDYGVRQSPYLNGTADIVRDFVAACHRGGVSPCLYFIPPMDTYESNVKVIELSHCKMTLANARLDCIACLRARALLHGVHAVDGTFECRHPRCCASQKHNDHNAHEILLYWLVGARSSLTLTTSGN
jgi:hypothetical protein